MAQSLPITHQIIKDLLTKIFPGTDPEYGARIGGGMYRLYIWQFEVEISHTTNNIGQATDRGDVTVSLSYKPEDPQKVGVSRVPISRETLTKEEELCDALLEVKQYLQGVLAAIEIALTKPYKEPESALQLFDD